MFLLIDKLMYLGLNFKVKNYSYLAKKSKSQGKNRKRLKEPQVKLTLSTSAYL